ncbi:MAG TPA: polysaccharide lyase 8 family protein [Mycobacteriales bacterium]|nr:polysaccharide lyase 8 family protein [Mycobacteriales bacterium]
MNDFDRVRLQWLSTLISPASSDPVVAKYVADSTAVAQQHWHTMNRSPLRSHLWADLDSSTSSAAQRLTMDRLRSMALALKTPGSPLAEDQTLQTDLVAAVNWFLTHKYGGVPRYGNWWDWEIGIPLALNDTCVLLYEDLSGPEISKAMSAISRYAPTPSQVHKQPATGTNLNWACSIALLRGALSHDQTALTSARTAWSSLFPYATSGDGFYEDGGFIQHSHFAYNGGYGSTLLQYLAYSMIALHGSAWAFDDRQIATVSTWIQLNYVPWLHDGAFMDMTRGRNVSRSYDTDHTAGRATSAALLQIAGILAPKDAALIRSQVKGLIKRDTFLPFFRFDATDPDPIRVPSIVAGRSVVADPSISLAGNSPSSLVATSMARAVYRRPGFAYAVAMDNTKIQPYEHINEENQRGWYTGEGSVYLYVPSQVGHWADAYWPTADLYRIPGITRDTRTLRAGEPRAAANSWAGGAILDGLVAAGMSVAPVDQTLRAHKSWFCVDDAIYCLGAGISSSDGFGVETVVENRNIGEGGLLPLTVNGHHITTTSVKARSYSADWAAIDSVCGYVFPDPVQLQAVREDRRGRWTALGSGLDYTDTTLYNRRYITMWLDHGKNPKHASYAYIQLPGASAADTAKFSTNKTARIAANTHAVQAVARPDLLMINFWEAGAPAVDGVAMDRPGSVIVSDREGRTRVAICDPTTRLAGGATLTIPRSLGEQVGGNDQVSSVVSRNSTTLTVDLTGAAGKSYVATFSH